MATRRRPTMGDRLDGGTPAKPATVTPINRGRDAFSADTAPAAGGTPLEVPIGLVDPSPDNPRADMGDLDGLVESIKELGVLQPLLVRPNGDRFALVYGHRRLAAAELAKRKTVPVFLSVDVDEARDHSRRVVENLHRKDLTPIEEARAYAQLMALGVKGGQRGIAKMVSKSQAYVSKRLSLLDLPDGVQAKVDSGEIPIREAIELARLADEPTLVKRALKNAENSWGGLAATVKREIEAREDEQARRAEADILRAAGVKVEDEQGPFSRQHGPYPLFNLSIDAAEHAKLSCHGAVVPPRGRTVTLVCFDPQVHLKADDTESEEQARRAAERAEFEANRLAAARARQTFTEGLVRKGSPDAGAAMLLGQVIGGQHYYLRVEEDAVAALLALDPDTFDARGAAGAIEAYVAKSTRNAQRAVYATGLALGESAITGHDARLSARRRYLDHLVACGYDLSDFEKQLVASAQADDDDYDDDEPFGADEEEAAGEGEGGES